MGVAGARIPVSGGARCVAHGTWCCSGSGGAVLLGPPDFGAISLAHAFARHVFFFPPHLQEDKFHPDVKEPTSYVKSRHTYEMNVLWWEDVILELANEITKFLFTFRDLRETDVRCAPRPRPRHHRRALPCAPPCALPLSPRPHPSPAPYAAPYSARLPGLARGLGHDVRSNRSTRPRSRRPDTRSLVLSCAVRVPGRVRTTPRNLPTSNHRTTCTESA